jgi:putative membrane protein
MKRLKEGAPVRERAGSDRILSEPDRSRLDGLVAEAERRTGTQIVLAVVRRSDAYPELPWKAFALGAAMSGLSVALLGAPFGGWSARIAALAVGVAVLACGAAFALAAVLAPPFGRLFLSAFRAETEVRQCAESMFLSRELFATGGRKGILLLVSLFERRTVLLPDRGWGVRLDGPSARGITAAMTPALRRREVPRALETGLESLVRFLEAAPAGVPGGRGANELADGIIEEKGP